ncbi:MAG: hypothetical protein WAZ12_04345 [Candidatus Absconditicoccaceae bacterium]
MTGKNLNNVGNQSDASKNGLKSFSLKAIASMALFAILLTIANPTKAQKILTKKEIENVLDKAVKSQDEIGEDMAQLLFGGGLEREIQAEVEKQNSKHPDANSKGKNSLFKNKSVKGDDVNGEILSKTEMEELVLEMIDSTATKDFATFYKSFHNYQKAGENLMGHKNGKGEMGSGRNLLPFPVMINVDYFENTKLPYSKDELENLKGGFEGFYNRALSKRKAEALNSRKNDDPKNYESADLLALEKSRQEFVKNVYEKYVKPIIEKVFKQYYSNAKDVNNNTKK